VKTAKLLMAVVLAVPLAILSGAHALSSASLRNAPELAIAVFPFNGLASEKLAYGKFADGVKDALAKPSGRAVGENALQADMSADFKVGATDLQEFAASTAQSARDAFSREPLLPKAHALLALSETDPQRKTQIITLASRLNRRELALQGLVLQQKVDEGDYAGTITTLDQILRVHPERKAEFFPLLVDAMAQSATKPAFVALLRDPLPWRDAFLEYAAGQPKVLENLAAIRADVSIDNLVFDQRLIAGLAAQGNLDSAGAIYDMVSQRGQKNNSDVWRSDYPPFDWKLANTAGLRAQPSKDLSVLEFAIEPGNGGSLASRMLLAPSSTFEVRFGHTINSQSQAKDLKLRISCRGASGPFFEEPFVNGEQIFKIGSPPSCKYLEMAITGRAWTGSSELSGTIEPLELNPL